MRTLLWGRITLENGSHPEQEQLPLFDVREARVQARALATTHPAAVVADFDDGLVLPEIPHHCLATGVSRRQNVLGLAVPRQCFNVFRGVLRQDGERDSLPSPELSDRYHSAPPNGPQEAERRREVPPTNGLRNWDYIFQEGCLSYWGRSGEGGNS